MMRRYLAEFVGTFMIVFAPVALSATSSFQGGASGSVAAAFVSGLVVLAMIATFGPISAAHFNPAVTLGFAVAKRFAWKHVGPYMFAQFLGGIAAAGLVTVLFGRGHGTHIPVDGQVLRNVTLEAVLGFMLMLTIIAVATDRRVNSALPAIAIGLVVVVGVMIGAPITGGSMNPARSLGPALLSGGAAWSSIWLYLVGPPVGAVVAALVYEGLRLSAGDAQCAPNLQ